MSLRFLWGHETVYKEHIVAGHTCGIGIFGVLTTETTKTHVQVIHSVIPRSTNLSGQLIVTELVKTYSGIPPLQKSVSFSLNFLVKYPCLWHGSAEKNSNWET